MVFQEQWGKETLISQLHWRWNLFVRPNLIVDDADQQLIV